MYRCVGWCVCVVYMFKVSNTHSIILYVHFLALLTSMTINVYQRSALICRSRLRILARKKRYLLYKSYLIYFTLFLASFYDVDFTFTTCKFIYLLSIYDRPTVIIVHWPSIGQPYHDQHIDQYPFRVALQSHLHPAPRNAVTRILRHSLGCNGIIRYLC